MVCHGASPAASASSSTRKLVRRRRRLGPADHAPGFERPPSRERVRHHGHRHFRSGLGQHQNFAPLQPPNAEKVHPRAVVVVLIVVLVIVGGSSSSSSVSDRSSSSSLVWSIATSTGSIITAAATATTTVLVVAVAASPLFLPPTTALPTEKCGGLTRRGAAFSVARRLLAFHDQAPQPCRLIVVVATIAAGKGVALFKDEMRRFF
mmetsp:Transcript_5658/g.11813  ORF Transcript_5658/g.11813 Transcript_5658/m.11813 type:complete len:206 (+) Transcript_5658:595-1212(+)